MFINLISYYPAKMSILKPSFNNLYFNLQIIKKMVITNFPLLIFGTKYE